MKPRTLITRVSSLYKVIHARISQYLAVERKDEILNTMATSKKPTKKQLLYSGVTVITEGGRGNYYNEGGNYYHGCGNYSPDPIAKYFLLPCVSLLSKARQRLNPWRTNWMIVFSSGFGDFSKALASAIATWEAKNHVARKKYSNILQLCGW